MKHLLGLFFKDYKADLKDYVCISLDYRGILKDYRCIAKDYRGIRKDYRSMFIHTVVFPKFRFVRWRGRKYLLKFRFRTS